jgi:hypothetical protein
MGLINPMSHMGLINPVGRIDTRVRLCVIQSTPDSKNQKYEKLHTRKTNYSLIGAKVGRYNAQHIWLKMIVFIIAEVATLPQLAHLMAEEGCYKDKTVDRSGKKVLIHRECGTGRNSQHETFG